MTDLWRLTATETVRKLRKREVSPLELVEAAASRIEAVEPKINALPIRFFDEARDYARRFKHESRDDPGWLSGLPMAVKDYNDVAGQLTTYGSPIFAEHRARADDRTIATLRANGAIPLAKSNVPEFAGSHTFNQVWGITRNPWSLDRTAGGSSGAPLPRLRQAKSGWPMVHVWAARCASPRASAALSACAPAQVSCREAMDCRPLTACGWTVRWRATCRIWH